LIKIFECVKVGLSDGVEDEIKLTTFVFVRVENKLVHKWTEI